MVREKRSRVLEDHDVSLCLSDHHLAPAPWVATAGHVYVRGHGPDGRYRGHYPDATLHKWSGRLARWQREGRRAYVSFDNDQKTAAPADADRLIALRPRLFGRLSAQAAAAGLAAEEALPVRR